MEEIADEVEGVALLRRHADRGDHGSESRDAREGDDRIFIKVTFRKAVDDAVVLGREQRLEGLRGLRDPIDADARKRGGEKEEHKGHPGAFPRLDKREDQVEQEACARNRQHDDIKRPFDISVIQGNGQHRSRIRRIHPEIDKDDRAGHGGGRLARAEDDDHQNHRNDHRGGNDVEEKAHELADRARGEDGEAHKFIRPEIGGSARDRLIEIGEPVLFEEREEGVEESLFAIDRISRRGTDKQIYLQQAEADDGGRREKEREDTIERIPLLFGSGFRRDRFLRALGEHFFHVVVGHVELGIIGAGVAHKISPESLFSWFRRVFPRKVFKAKIYKF